MSNETEELVERVNDRLDGLASDCCWVAALFSVEDVRQLSQHLQAKERECEKWKHKYQQAVSSDDYTGPRLAK